MAKYPRGKLPLPEDTMDELRSTGIPRGYNFPGAGAQTDGPMDFTGTETGTLAGLDMDPSSVHDFGGKVQPEMFDIPGVGPVPMEVMMALQQHMQEMQARDGQQKPMATPPPLDLKPRRGRGMEELPQSAKIRNPFK